MANYKKIGNNGIIERKQGLLIIRTPNQKAFETIIALFAANGVTHYIPNDLVYQGADGQGLRVTAEDATRFRAGTSSAYKSRLGRGEYKDRHLILQGDEPDLIQRVYDYLTSPTHLEVLVYDNIVAYDEEGNVTVGCQKIPAEAVDEIHRRSQGAREKAIQAALKATEPVNTAHGPAPLGPEKHIESRADRVAHNNQVRRYLEAQATKPRLQVTASYANWKITPNPTWDQDLTYRIHPEDHPDNIAHPVCPDTHIDNDDARRANNERVRAYKDAHRDAIVEFYRRSNAAWEAVDPTWNPSTTYRIRPTAA
jgi:hypothetical protein